MVPLAVFVALAAGCAHQDWRTADKSSMAIAPSPEVEPRAIIQIYAARTVRWRRYFAVHSWIALKDKNSRAYKVYQVIGFRRKQGLSVVSVQEDQPDRRWFGNEPELLLDLRGAAAERAIPKIHEAALSYPYPHEYRAWPGPNSNTFVSHISRQVSELKVELPPHAIGKDWIGKGDLIGASESGTGFQLSIFGAFGLTLGLAEGVEINLLGLSFGVDILRPALKLPLVGRLGFADAQVFTHSGE
ncbi:MAG: hypothetical protein A2070_07855 [Bdellovibrionales bacterium GWC1_52_8]|nr:MAG: hypothetical protein A2Z97_13940 [Bdellovibrionales bacterium GWB1_52_6]OFZ06450.1 MAG: hypothetical protein A2X97_02990 [Bdellovibrionales bacterium GWA1_52_35]OFZ39981.1 MAG: hypothetical protein A2070_07855 [Bdellovibrionales bacterium GWC1_52_8]